MKNELKISTLAMVCVLCTAVSGAYGASSIRSLGGSGTYNSASSAAAANTSSGSNAIAAARGGSVRVTPTTGKTGTTVKPAAGTTTSGRVATTPRLSIGKYLGGGTSISGGSSIKPQGPGSSSSGSTGGGSMDPGTAADLQLQVDQVRRDVDKLQDVDIAFSDKLLEKQDLLNTTADGYIIIDDTTNEIYVDVENLKDELNTVAGKDGREVEIGSNDDNLLWRYVGDTTWNILISKNDITGPQGPQGEKGEKGDKGEPGDAASIDLSEYAKTADIAASYATTAAMNTAIASAIATASANYATAAQGALAETALQPGALTGYATKVDIADMATTTDLAGKADKSELTTLATKATTLAGYGITDAYTTTQIDKKLEDITVGGLEGVETVLATKADTTYVNEQLATKADKSSLGTLATKSAIVNADVADDAAIAKTKLATDVQASLTKADQAVSTSDAPRTGDHVLAVSNGEKAWFEVVY